MPNQPGSLLKIGHRGAMGYEPENTVRSFKKAIELGADMVEMDVYRCGSGDLVVFHDMFLHPKTDGRGAVMKKNLGEIKNLNISGEPIPTLKEVLDFINRRAKVNLELKTKKAVAGTVRLVNHYVRDRGWSYDDFVISSFYRKILKRVRELNPCLKLGLIQRVKSWKVLKFAKAVNLYSLHLNWKIINPYIIQNAHAQNLKIFVWTVNDQEDMTRFKHWGVDGIFSDYPDRIR